MDKKIFKETFSSVHASEQLISEVLMMNTEKTKSKTRVTLKLALAAVIMVSVFATTVFAATAVYRFFNAEVEDLGRTLCDTDENGVSEVEEAYELRFEFEMKDNAPALIQEYYLPQIPEKYPQCFGYAYGGLGYDRLGTITLAWEVPNVEKMGIMFFQHSAEGFEGKRTVMVKSGSEPEMVSKILGGVEGLLILAPDESIAGRKYFCWCNGDYVFEIMFPYEFSDAEMSAIIESVDKVEDIRPYLISMTDEEIEKTFE